MIWVAIALIGVIVVKYYTSFGKRKLEERLTRVKAQLVDAREKLKSTRKEQAEVNEEVEVMEETH